MARNEYIAPGFSVAAFHCGVCGVFAKQFWSHLTASSDGYSRPHRGTRSNIYGSSEFSELLPEQYVVSKCEHCSGYCIWLNEVLVLPRSITVDQPNGDLNPDIQADYNEAAQVLADSPRAAAALLRLGLQKLCVQLGQKGKNINDDIAELVNAGLSPTIQKALDALRITGNNAVHPGEINLDEDPAKVVALFSLINFIAQKLITEPKEIEALYDALPDDAKTAVEKRDKDGK